MTASTAARLEPKASPAVAPPAPAAVETEPTAAVHPCDVCPTRLTAQDQRYDYCEGCPNVERYCQSCQRHRPQVGWWWGMRWGSVSWVCAACRFEPPDVATLLRFPEWESHPALASIAASHGRFAAEVDLGDATRRMEVAAALGRAAQRPVDAGAALVLGRLAAAARDASADGLAVEAADIGVPSRLRVSPALSAAAGDPHVPVAASEVLGRLGSAWDRWVAGQLPQPPRGMSEAERTARERAAARRGRERVVR